MTDTPETDACWDSASCNPRLHAQQLERERDEALHKLELCMAANSDVARIARERDEARNRMADALQELDLRTLDFERMRAERDEAREALPDGEWVSYDDHKKVHDAASRLLVAINKQLPIGFFGLLAKEYDALQSALYGRDTTQ